MSRPADADVTTPWQPRFPTLLAAGVSSFWVLILCLPMFAGRFLVNERSDQMFTGVPFRWFLAQEWQRTGDVPLWNPYMFGGLPFVGAMHGDIFYPTAWLRLVLPIDTAMNLGFAVHVMLAGFFAYLFLRVIRTSWTGAVAGGLAYQLCGVVASLVSPGHDGKLFVSALMPMVLTGLVLGIRDRRLEGFGLLALAAGAGIISPHIQMMQYTLIFAGLFTLYLCFWSPDRPEPKWRYVSLGLALGAVALAFGIAMIQLYPFIKYMPFAARSADTATWEYATSYAIPADHLLDFVVGRFAGTLENYWGSNFFKLHSEYLGLATILLAIVGIGSAPRRKMVWFFGAAGVLFLLVSLGGHTPFYRIWYEIVPGAKVTRAAGMAFFIPSFVVAVLAAFGVERIEAREGRKVITGGLIAAGVVLLLGVSGVFGSMAERWADGIDRNAAAQGQQLPVPRATIARGNSADVALGSAQAALFGAAVMGLGLLWVTGRMRSKPALAGGLAFLIGGDLFLNARPFWQYTDRADVIYADDAITQRLAAVAPPYRAFDTGVYPTAYLMGKRVPTVLGHHGNELHNYDNLLGGKNQWTNLFRSTRLWDLLAVRYVLVGQQANIPGYHNVLGPTRTTPGGQGILMEADTAPRYARVVSGAAKLPEEQIVPTLLDPRLDFNRLVLFANDAPIDVPQLTAMPEPSASRAEVTAWEPGAMTIRLDPAPAAAAYLLVSENWYGDWRATVDGQPALSLRGDYSLLTVPVPAGAREIKLVTARDNYRTGAMLTFGSLAASLGWALVPLFLRKKRG